MIQKEVLPLKVVELLVPIYVKSEIRKGHRHGPVRSKFFSPLQVKSGDKKKKICLKLSWEKILEHLASVWWYLFAQPCLLPQMRT